MLFEHALEQTRIQLPANKKKELHRLIIKRAQAEARLAQDFGFLEGAVDLELIQDTHPAAKEFLEYSAQIQTIISKKDFSRLKETLITLGRALLKSQ